MKNKVILVVNGKAGAGKDTFACMLNNHTAASVYKYSAVSKVKQIASACGWNGGKTEHDRRFLCDLKNLTTWYNDMSFKDISEIVDKFKNGIIQADILVIDIREPGEIGRACDEFGAYSVFIENKRVKHVMSNTADSGVYDYNYDFTVDNNGSLTDFKKNVKRFYIDLMEANWNECN